MKAILSSILLCSVHLYSQQIESGAAAIEYVFNNQFDYYYSLNLTEKKSLAEHHVAERKTTYVGGRKQSTSVEKFNAEGSITSHESYDEKGELISHCHYTYNESGQLIFQVSSYKKKQSKTWYSYNEMGKLINLKTYDAKNQYHGNKWLYNEAGKLIQAEIYFKDSLHPLRTLQYDYYDNASIKSIQYFSKGELKYTWAYDCKPEGELLEQKRTDSTTICILEELDENGNKIEWKQEFDSKGRPTKTKRVYSADSRLMYSASYDVANRLIREANHFNDGGYLILRYKPNGKLIGTTEAVYNISGERVFYSYTARKYYSHSWYIYENGLMTEQKRLTKNKQSSIAYSYSFHP